MSKFEDTHLFEEGLTDLIHRMRQNVNKEFVLPNHYGWDEKDWCSKFPPSPTKLEVRIRDFGCLIGRFLKPCWENLIEIETEFPIIYIATSLVNITVARETAKDLSNIRKLKDREFDVMNSSERITQMGMADLFIDALSTFYFEIQRANVELKPKPKFGLHFNDEILHEIEKNLTLVQVVYHAFERVLFLGSDFSCDDGSIRISTSSSDRGREFLYAQALSTALDDDMDFVTRWRILENGTAGQFWKPKYRLVDRVTLNGSSLDFSLAPLENSAALSRIEALRGRTGTEYMFEALYRNGDPNSFENFEEFNIADESIEILIIYAWDILYSVASAVFNEFHESNDPYIIFYIYPEQDINALFSISLGVSPNTSRQIMSHLVLKGRPTDGLWSKPLQEIEGRGYQLLLPAVLSQNPSRFLGLMTQNLGKSDRRGKFFERKANQLIRRFTGPGTNVRFAPLPTTHDLHVMCNSKERETDVILVEGNYILVCEVKSFKQVAGPREYHWARSSISKAKLQLDKRLDMLKKNKDFVCDVLGIKGSPKFYGLIVSSGRFFEGLNNFGYPIVDLRNMMIFFQKDEQKSGFNYFSEENLFESKLTKFRDRNLTDIENLMIFAAKPPDCEFHERLLVSRTERLQFPGLEYCFDRVVRDESLGMIERRWSDPYVERLFDM